MAYNDYQMYHARYPDRYTSPLVSNGDAIEYDTDPDLDVRAVPDYHVDKAPSEGALPVAPTTPPPTTTAAP